MCSRFLWSQIIIHQWLLDRTCGKTGHQSALHDRKENHRRHNGKDRSCSNQSPLNLLTAHEGLQTYWQRLKPLDTNYYLFPFLADENGAPVADLNFPMTVLFWYPSAAWKQNEIVIGKTVITSAVAERFMLVTQYFQQMGTRAPGRLETAGGGSRGGSSWNAAFWNWLFRTARLL